MLSKWQRNGQVNRTTQKESVMEKVIEGEFVDHYVQQQSFIHSTVGQACCPQTKSEAFSFKVVSKCLSILDHISVLIGQTLGILGINDNDIQFDS